MMINPGLERHLLSMEPAKMLDVMYDALDLMQQWNGRSVESCIFEAAGWKQVDDRWMLLPVDSKKEGQ